MLTLKKLLIAAGALALASTAIQAQNPAGASPGPQMGLHMLSVDWYGDMSYADFTAKYPNCKIDSISETSLYGRSQPATVKVLHFEKSPTCPSDTAHKRR